MLEVLWFDSSLIAQQTLLEPSPDGFSMLTQEKHSTAKKGSATPGPHQHSYNSPFPFTVPDAEQQEDRELLTRSLQSAMTGCYVGVETVTSTAASQLPSPSNYR